MWPLQLKKLTKFVIIRSMLVTCHAVEIGAVDVDVDIDNDLQVNFVVFLCLWRFLFVIFCSMQS